MQIVSIYLRFVIYVALFLSASANPIAKGHIDVSANICKPKYKHLTDNLDFLMDAIIVPSFEFEDINFFVVLISDSDTPANWFLRNSE